MSSSTHHKSAGKISLHAIVGSTNNSETNSSSSSTAASWQQQPPQRSSRLLEQPALFGSSSNSNSNSLTKSRVGVADCSAGAGGVGDAADDLPRHRQQTQSNGLTTTPTQQMNRQPRRDLESFRHYNNNHGITSTSTSSTSSTSANGVDDDDLRLTSRHQRRQQIPEISENSTLQRSRSISTDDLSTAWDTHGGATEEPGEWRRVSKLRRSFQSTTNTNDSYNSPTTSRRPRDLPTNSVSVSKIRAELENGRRLHTAMRNNHVDLAALSSILNGPTESKPEPSKSSTFLTAESLKEIRGKLKKLSDESLYKEDFMAHQQPPKPNQHIEIRDVRKAPERNRLRQLTPEQSPEISPPKSAFQAVPRQAELAPPVNSFMAARALSTATQKRTTNSLESRQKYKDTASNEWHLRRKSYGFEKMSPSDDPSMFRMDASTDSGLGRSGELGNWSPTEGTPAVRGTVIHFGEPAKIVTSAAVQRRNRQLKSIETPQEQEEELLKRHSIAVDESQYVRENLRKTSQVRLSGLYDAGMENTTKSLQPTGFESTELTQNSHSTSLFQRTQQKRVEFCKTEVHFAAESGRVNIVETDGKPPPTNNFRRRRRTTSGPLQSLVKAAPTSLSDSASVALPITHFGDDHRRSTIVSTATVAYKAALEDEHDNLEASNVTVSIPNFSEVYALTESSRSSYASTSGIDTTDGENDEIAAIRGILKNKPIKPKPYHLGENFDSADALWGVQLKPVTGGGTLTGRRETVTDADSPIALTINKSVAERVRMAEKRQDHNTLTQTQSNGYSTKINLSIEDTPKDWSNESDLPKSNIMSIELHSPQASLEHATHLKVAQPPPVAKPRTVVSERILHPQVHTAATVKQTEPHASGAEPLKEPLKIIKEARGARRLRDHELSYFGVQVARKNDVNEAKTKQLPKRTLPQRKLSEDISKPNAQPEPIAEKQTTKWQLLNDKPDLLRHSPITVEPQVVSRTAEIKPTERKTLQQSRKQPRSPVPVLAETDEEEDDEHFYENITSELTPIFKVKNRVDRDAYDRKMDLKRDAMNLSEMTRNADQTLKALSDEAALKDQRRRSSQRRNSKPLETIDEKTIAERINDKCIAVKVSRSTLASEAKRTSRHSTPSPTTVASRARTSSQSSVESCPRARSRSLSSEREYENVKTKPIKPPRSSTAAAKSMLKASNSRSSSRESHRSSHAQCSSGEEVGRHEETRLRTKTKRVTATSQPREKRSKDYERREKHHSSSNDEKHHKLRAASSTKHSSQRERIECTTEAATPRQHRSAEASARSNSRRRREEARTSGLARSTGVEKHDRHERSSAHHTGGDSGRLVRTSRGHEHDSTPRSSHRSERTEKEKAKLVRTKGHSSRTTTHQSERNATSQHHATSPTKTREHTKSKTAATPTTTTTCSETKHPQHETMTHGKNIQLTNGHHSHHYQHPAQHVHSMTTTTKPRERSGKDRK